MGRIKYDLYLPFPNFALKIKWFKHKGVLKESLESLVMFMFRNRNIIENIAVFLGKTDVPHLLNQSMVEISVMNLEN